ncbi:MAG TPA: globin-coupled sensor protein [Solirubrobacteraceae bacterium]|nr:globin-coupled sensor protein [Solirubrobacteraceae bacterium]
MSPSPAPSLAELHHLTPENLALRRRFIGLDDDVLALLARLAPWAEEVADTVAEELTRHHFEFSATARFFRRHVEGKPIGLSDLRAGWQKAQAAHWRAIFAEPAGPEPFGVAYFGALLEVGALHSRINLPLKWYLGSYPAFMDAVRHALRATPPEFARIPTARFGGRRNQAPLDLELLAAAERAIAIVFNYDLQAITDAFYYDQYASIGVDLRVSRDADPTHDLSDCGPSLKAAVHDSLGLFIDSSQGVHGVFGQLQENIMQTTDAMAGIAVASAQVADGAERQAEMLQRSRELSAEVSAATARGQELGAHGIEAVKTSNEVMRRVRDSGEEAQVGIEELARKSGEIGGILQTITGIADQTNLLALNAAIEAARAGEHGAGFAVVAEEVRKLAEKSAGSASTIGELVEEIQQGIARVVGLVHEAAELAHRGVESSESAHEAFVEIGDAITAISDRVSEMSGTSTEIAAVAEQSSASAQQMSSSAQQSSAQSQELTASLEDLARTAERLLEASRQFSLR